MLSVAFDKLTDNPLYYISLILYSAAWETKLINRCDFPSKQNNSSILYFSSSICRYISSMRVVNFGHVHLEEVLTGGPIHARFAFVRLLPGMYPDVALEVAALAESCSEAVRTSEVGWQNRKLSAPNFDTGWCFAASLTLLQKTTEQVSLGLHSSCSSPNYHHMTLTCHHQPLTKFYY